MPTDHLTQEALQRLAAAVRAASPLPSPQHSAHLEACPECRERLRALLRLEMPEAGLPESDPDDPFAACLRDEEALRLVRHQLDALEAETIGFHLEECAACRALIADLTAFAAKMEALPLLDGNTGQETLDRQSWERQTSWLARLGAEFASIRERLRAPVYAYGFATSVPEEMRQTLEFDSADFTGSYRAEEDRRLLHLEHASCAPGTLVLLEAMTSSEQVAWRCLAVFRRGMRRSVLDVEADVPADLCTLRAGLLEPGVLISPICAELPAASATQLRTDSAARSGWEIWARRTLAEPVDPFCRTAAEAILAAVTPE